MFTIRYRDYWIHGTGDQTEVQLQRKDWILGWFRSVRAAKRFVRHINP